MSRPGGNSGQDIMRSTKPKYPKLSLREPGNESSIRIHRFFAVWLRVDASRPVGFSICVLHEGTWTMSPICYLEDLFVDPRFRLVGIGRRLMQDVVDRARANQWSRVYWHTRVGNPAGRLYDKFAQADDFVRYRLLLEFGSSEQAAGRTRSDDRARPFPPDSERGAVTVTRPRSDAGTKLKRCRNTFQKLSPSVRNRTDDNISCGLNSNCRHPGGRIPRRIT
jgi:GNAT superfamily N-acetyltransferase